MARGPVIPDLTPESRTVRKHEREQIVIRVVNLWRRMPTGRRPTLEQIIETIESDPPYA